MGLGNPGTRYRTTRHNVGFMVVEALAERCNVAFGREKYKSLIAEAVIGREKVLLLKPLTFMNLSGNSVAMAARYKVHDPLELFVISDDVNLPLGRLRVRKGGSAGGHNGLKSIIERVGTKDFSRLRIGVGDNRSGRDLSGHVLSKFMPDERECVEQTVLRAVDAAICFVESGVDAAMNEYNKNFTE